MVSLCKLRLSGSFRHLQADSRGSRGFSACDKQWDCCNGPCLSGYAKRLDPGPSIGSWVKWPLIRVSQSSTLLFEMCGLPITYSDIWGPKQRNYKHHNTPLHFPPIAYAISIDFDGLLQTANECNMNYVPTCILQTISHRQWISMEINWNQWISWYGSAQTRAMPSCASQHLRCPESGTTSAKHPVANMASTCQSLPWSN